MTNISSYPVKEEMRKEFMRHLKGGGGKWCREPQALELEPRFNNPLFPLWASDFRFLCTYGRPYLLCRFAHCEVDVSLKRKLKCLWTIKSHSLVRIIRPSLNYITLPYCLWNWHDCLDHSTVSETWKTLWENMCRRGIASCVNMVHVCMHLHCFSAIFVLQY